MMKRPLHSHRRHGTTAVLTMITISLLAIMAVYTLRKVGPKLRMAYQTAGWQESRLAAESGIDVALGELSKNASLGASPKEWTGWKQEKNGIIGPALAATLNTINSILSALLGIGGSATVSDPIFLDNMKVSSPNGANAEVDVQLWAVQTNGKTNGRWFRIRSMGTCALPQPAYSAPDALDSSLRRYSLRNIRPQLRRNDVGQPMTVPMPNASRTIEVLVEPILPFELAIFTNDSMSLGTSGTWGVDSYDSRDPAKSNSDGTYPGRTSTKVGNHGNVASNRARPADSLYGPLISVNGTQVRGTIATNGGDDPRTDVRENIDGAGKIDPTLVRDDFFREMRPMARPTDGIMLAAPISEIVNTVTDVLSGLLGGGSNTTTTKSDPIFVAGKESSPNQYLIPGNLGAFRVSAPPLGTKGEVTILINGDLDVASGTITIPDNVTAQLFVRGNIDFHSNPINVSPSSSRRPGNLQIYGEDSKGEPRSLKAYGDALICAAFYGPQYDVRLTSNVEWVGAVAAKSFEMAGGGRGGFHYDEALASVGTPIGFRIARYVEDVRE